STNERLPICPCAWSNHHSITTKCGTVFGAWKKEAPGLLFLNGQRNTFCNWQDYPTAPRGTNSARSPKNSYAFGSSAASTMPVPSAATRRAFTDVPERSYSLPVATSSFIRKQGLGPLHQLFCVASWGVSKPYSFCSG